MPQMPPPFPTAMFLVKVELDASVSTHSKTRIPPPSTAAVLLLKVFMSNATLVAVHAPPPELPAVLASHISPDAMLHVLPDETYTAPP